MERRGHGWDESLVWRAVRVQAAVQAETAAGQEQKSVELNLAARRQCQHAISAFTWAKR